MTKLELRELLRSERAIDWRVPIYGGEIYIRTKNRSMVALEPNPVQERLIERIWELEQAGRPVRILIPKARQHGISTITEAIIFAKTSYQENISAIIVADTREHARNIFKMSKLMYEKMNVAHRPDTRKSNATELAFNENHSEIIIATDARSGTFHLFHSSETAYYPHAEETMLGVLQTVPDGPGTMIIMESTGNGIGNYFYQRCMEAKAGTNDYELFFIPWWENEEYQTTPEEDLIPQEHGPYGNEVREQERYNLSHAQLQWRRNTIRNKCGGDLRMFMQEYPGHLDECFQASGSPVFDQVLLNEIQMSAKLPLYRGHIENTQVIITKTATTGPLRVWEKPEKGWRNRYVIGVDTGGVWEGADYSVAYVIDREARTVPAMLHGHFDAYEFARMVVTIAKWYDNAKLAIETNKLESETDDMGNAVIKRILDEVKYANMYRRQSVDEHTKKPTRKIGWNTNRETKQMIVDRLRQFTLEYADFPIHYYDYELIEEMKTYVIDTTDGGKTTWNAQKGCNDDRLMAFGIALCVSKEMPRPKILTPYKSQEREAS